MAISFNSKTVLITGGASGIGKIMVRKALEREAAKVVVWDINTAGLELVSKEYSHLGGTIICVPVDLNNTDAILEGLARTAELAGTIDILINNAGIVFGDYFHQHQIHHIQQTMKINSESPMIIAHALIQDMIAQNAGSICNIASSAGLVSNPRMSVYAASKWAVVGWSDSLWLEMKALDKDVHITTVMPFFISTGMFEGVKSPILPILRPEKVAESIITAIETKQRFLAMPLRYRFIRFCQGILPVAIFDWFMRDILKIYHTMDTFTGRQ